jgi:hypothetical protein
MPLRLTLRGVGSQAAASKVNVVEAGCASAGVAAGAPVTGAVGVAVHFAAIVDGQLRLWIITVRTDFKVWGGGVNAVVCGEKLGSAVRV